MESTNHSFQDLFLQLGLPDDDASIDRFVTAQRPLPPGLRIYDAPFWSAAQASFLKEKLREDGDWAMLIDRLDAQLRDHPAPQDADEATAIREDARPA